MMNVVRVILAAIIGFDLAVALFATNEVVIGICKYLEIFVSVTLLCMTCFKYKK